MMCLQVTDNYSYGNVVSFCFVGVESVNKYRHQNDDISTTGSE